MLNLWIVANISRLLSRQDFSIHNYLRPVKIAIYYPQA